MNIIKNLLPEKEYPKKSPYLMTPIGVTIHNTANDLNARQEIAYMIKRPDIVSFHYAVDDKEICQGVPENRNAWHAGDGNGKGNRKTIAIEICFSKSGGNKFLKAEQLAAELTADILFRYGWTVEKNVYKHQDWSGKYCPHRTLDMGWGRFLTMVKRELDKLKRIPVLKEPITVEYKDQTIKGFLTDENKTVAEVRDLAENFGLEVEWDSKTRTVRLK